MASAFAGKYQHDKDENLEEYYKCLGLSDDDVQKFKKPWRTCEIVVDGNMVTITTNNKMMFKLGTPYDEKVGRDQTLKSLGNMDGNKLIIKSEAADGRKGVRMYELNDQGFVITMSSDTFPVMGRIFYKRV